MLMASADSKSHNWEFLLVTLCQNDSVIYGDHYYHHYGFVLHYYQ